MKTSTRKNMKWTIDKRASIFNTLSGLDISKHDVIELHNNPDTSDFKALINILSNAHILKFGEKCHKQSVHNILLEGLSIPITGNQTPNTLKDSILAAQSANIITTTEAMEALANIITNFKLI